MIESKLFLIIYLCVIVAKVPDTYLNIIIILEEYALNATEKEFVGIKISSVYYYVSKKAGFNQK